MYKCIICQILYFVPYRSNNYHCLGCNKQVEFVPINNYKNVIHLMTYIGNVKVIYLKKLTCDQLLCLQNELLNKG